MSEPTGEDFARLLGRSPEPEQEAAQKRDKPPAEQAETEPEVDAALVAALTQPKPWAEAFVRSLHPPDESKG
jgi:hypothetical protein